MTFFRGVYTQELTHVIVIRGHVDVFNSIRNGYNAAFGWYAMICLQKPAHRQITAILLVFSIQHQNAHELDSSVFCYHNVAVKIMTSVFFAFYGTCLHDAVHFGFCPPLGACCLLSGFALPCLTGAFATKRPLVGCRGCDDLLISFSFFVMLLLIAWLTPNGYLESCIRLWFRSPYCHENALYATTTL